MSNLSETAERPENDLLSMTTNIVSAYASHNQISQSELTDLISSIHGRLSGLSGDGSASEAGTVADDTPLVPAVPIDASVGEDEIVCLECGKSFKTLKRHLSSEHGLSPAEYRARWQLSKDYPLVAPNYSKRRAETAKKIGLGRKPGGGRPKKKK